MTVWYALKLWWWNRQRVKAKSLITPIEEVKVWGGRNDIPMCCGGTDPNCLWHGHGAVVG